MTTGASASSSGALALGVLDPEQRPALDAHLEGCPEWRAELARLKRVAGALAWWPRTPSPPP